MPIRMILTRLVVPVAATLLMIGAGPPATAPANPQPGNVAARPATATVIATEGVVQYRAGDDKPWQDAKVGQVVDIGGEFRTGTHSSVKFKIQPDQTVTLDRLGAVKLLQAIQNSDKQVTTDLGMKYGRVHYDVEAGDQVDHQATIRAPSATLAIRGTHNVTFFDQRPGLATVTGDRTVLTFHPHGSPFFIMFGSKNDKASQTVQEGNTGPVDYRHHDRIIDPGDRFARSDSEFQILGNYELYSGTDFTTFGASKFHGQSDFQSGAKLTGPSGCECGHGN